MKICLYCKFEYIPKPNIIKQKFCCRKCYYLFNKVKIISQVKAFNLKHPEVVARTRITSKLWYDKNPEYFKNYYKNRYYNDVEWKRKQDVRVLHWGYRKKLLKEYCEKCNSKENLQIHHICYENSVNTTKIKTLCKSCHKEEHLNKS